MNSELISRVSREVGLPESSVAATVALLEAGGTPPFIARYRKEATGGLDESKIHSIEERIIFYKELQDRRAAILSVIAAQGKLTDALRLQIETCFHKVELEDLFLPFRPAQRKSRAAEAAGRGLEPLAEYLWNQEPDAWSLEEHADVFIDPEKNVNSREEALREAAEIVSVWISQNSGYRKALRQIIWETGFVVSRVAPGRADQKTKYTMYYDRREPVAKIPSHRVLAIRRGTKEGILTSCIESDDARAIDFLRKAIIRDPESVLAPLLEIIIGDSYTRLIRPALEVEIRTQVKERADCEAIRVFQENLANLLLSPPGGPMVVLGVDPGKTEFKVAVVDESGKFLEVALISPLPPKGDTEGTRAILKDLIARHSVRALAIGAGAGSRELERVLRQILQEEKLESVLLVGVNDAGISVYASSRIGREEFPDLDSPSRSAIGMARRLQDPLAELVKIDPKTIGVGQYQHDVDQKELHRGLIRTVRSCVSRVGVDLNTGSFSLLRYVSGLNDRLARRIVNHRTGNGLFTSRTALLGVPGIDEQVFCHAAGFLRVQGGENPLDRTAVHPEAYPVAEKMAASLGVSVADLIENKTLVSSLKLEEFVTDTVGLPTLSDIREELLKPGRDPRRTFAVAKFRDDVKEISDLKEGMVLEGTVTNVTNFGAFVDVGVQQDGLVHLSQMSNRFIRDPREAVKVGDVVQVKVISVEAETKRIGLSMKALLPPVPHRRKHPRRARDRVAASEEPRPAEAVTVPEGVRGTSVFAEEVPAAEGRPQRPRHRSRRGHRKREARPPQPVTPTKPASPPNEKPAEPEPEPTLQEKIAILQSKFRGIN